MTTLNSPDRARSLLPRALQSLPTHHRLDMTSKFAQLEFRSPAGDAERGRTIFEGLLNTWPKRLDLYNVLIDLEFKQGEKERVRALFERVLAAKNHRLKPKKAKWFFKRWMEFEEKFGNQKTLEDVKRKAEGFVRSWKEKERDLEGEEAGDD